MKRLLLIANPAASGFTGGLHRTAASRLSRHFEVTAEWPKTAADTRQASAAAAADDFDLVVAMGGDGVVHHAANGIGGTRTALGIIPAGTTNVFARLAGIPAKPDEALTLLCRRPRPVPMAAGMLTLDHGEGRVESRIAAFSAGMGIDGETVRRAELEPYRKYLLGHLHYARATLSAAWEKYAEHPPGLIAETEGRSAPALTVLIQMQDRYSFFGRLPLQLGEHRPDAFTVLIVRSLPRRRILPLMLRALGGGSLARMEGIDIWEGVTSLAITPEPAENAPAIPAQADGELLGTPLKLSAAVRPGFLQVVRPP